MLNDLFRNYKKIVLLILLLLFAIFFWFFACHDQSGRKREPVTWEEETSEDGSAVCYRFSVSGLEGTVTFGAKGVIAPGKVSPIHIRASAGEEDFQGIVRVTLPGDDGKGIVHQSLIACDKGLDTDWKMLVPQLGEASCFCFEIIDTYNSVLISRTILPDWAKKESTNQILYMGVLCDDSRRLSYMDGMTLGGDEGSFTLRLIYYDKNDFPDEASDLAPLSCFLVDDFDTSLLSDAQKKGLIDYVRAGGSLLAGTGAGGHKTLAGLSDQLGLEDGKKKEEVIDFSGSVSLASRVNLTRDRVVPDEEAGWRQITEASARTGWERDMAEGKVYFTPYSFSEKAFSSWNHAGAVSSGLLRYIMEKSGLSFSEDQDMLKIWYLERSLYAFLSSVAPDTFYYGIFFLCYMAALILIGYYFLRRIRKREWIWLVVPLMSTGFVVFLLMHSGLFSRSDSNAFSLLKISEDSRVGDDYYFLYQNGKEESRNLGLTEDVRLVEPLDYEYRLDVQELPDVDTTKVDYTISNQDGSSSIHFSETNPGSSRLFHIYTDKTEASFLKGDIRTLPTTFYGTVSNEGKKTYSKIILIRGRQYALLQGLGPGERLVVDRDQVRCLSHYDEDPFSLDVQSGMEDEESVLSNILMYVENSWMNDTDRLEETILVGITEEVDPQIPVKENDLRHQIGLDLVHLPDGEGTDLEDENSEKADSNDSTGTRIISNINSYCLRSDEEGMLVRDTLEANKTKVSYQFGRDRDLVGLYRNRDSFTGTIYAYNYRSGKEEKILEKWDETLEGKKLEDYLSEQNVMILTYHLPKGEELGNTPVLSALLADPGE